MNIRKLIAYLSFLAASTSFSSTISWACPLCHTSTAVEVRKGLSATMQDKSVWIGMVLPFLAIGIVVGIMNSELQDHKIETETVEKSDDPEYQIS